MLRKGHQVQLLKGGQAFFDALVTAIDASLHEVRIETYIFSARGSVEPVACAMERAAQRGVAVYLVMDGAGTPRLAPQWVARFKAAGVQWRIFSPLGRLGLLMPGRWRRLHRKLCAIDGQVAFCGGINLIDDFYDPNFGVLSAPRFDFAVRVTGPLVQTVHESMAQFWWRLQAVRTVRKNDFPAAWAALQQAVKLALQVNSKFDPQGATPARSSMARLVLRDNVRNRTRIERTYRKAIGEAREEIILSNAYFFPGRKLRKSLIHAARRGVRVRLLLQGRYEYFMQAHAVRQVYGSLLAAGVEIHEYSVSFLHAKVAVIDRQWATVGSSNLDPLSLLLAREANVVVEDYVFSGDLRDCLEHAMLHGAAKVDPAAYASRPWSQRILGRMAFVLVRLALFLNGSRY